MTVQCRNLLPVQTPQRLLHPVGLKLAHSLEPSPPLLPAPSLFSGLKPALALKVAPCLLFLLPFTSYRNLPQIVLCLLPREREF